MKTYNTIHEAYLGSLQDVYDNPEYICAPRGQQVREVLNYSFKVLNPVNEPIVTKDLERNEVIKSYTKKECELYDSGTNSAKDFGEASKFWLKLANPDGTVNSAYGYLVKHKKSHGHPIYELSNGLSNLSPSEAAEYLAQNAASAMRTPYEWCLDSLKSDKDTRQAILRFSLPEHFYKGNKDMTCTLSGNFHIREDKLNLSIHMRSNDLMLGLVFDLPWFVSLMDDMINDLKDTYPDLQKGYYVHSVDSMHIYDRDKEKVFKMIGRNEEK
jgi:thymidylate synthase